MEHLITPAGYKPVLDLRETQVAIKEIKDFFQRELAKQLNLTRVSAPLFVLPESGLNDNLNGVERPVSFGILEQKDRKAEIVHSLAKWKRQALKEYGFQEGEGLYTDMSAIRRDEDTDNIHSIYVDQWDWEKIISKKDRTRETLESIVRSVYKALKVTEDYMAYEYEYIGRYLPENITFVTTQELEDMYPDCTPKEREYKIAKLHGAVFIEQIGDKMKSDVGIRYASIPRSAIFSRSCSILSRTSRPIFLPPVVSLLSIFQRIFDRLRDRLTVRRMRAHRRRELICRKTIGDRRCHLSDHVRRTRTHDLRPDQRVGIRLKNQAHKTAAVSR